MFKDSVLQNKKKRDFEKKQRLNVLVLRNRFLGEWASNILGLNQAYMKNYVSKIAKDKNHRPKIKKLLLRLIVIIILWNYIR